MILKLNFPLPSLARGKMAATLLLERHRAKRMKIEHELLTLEDQIHSLEVSTNYVNIVEHVKMFVCILVHEAFVNHRRVFSFLTCLLVCLFVCFFVIYFIIRASIFARQNQLEM